MIQELKKIALERGVFFNKTTKENLLEEFFKKVRPVTTNVPLIRLGGNSDAGYLIPDDFAETKSCFSPGVSLESYFENDLADLGIRSFLADYSVDYPLIENPLFKFEKKFLGIENDSVYMSLENWVDRNVDADESNMILQMDIEGSEYDVIIDTSNEVLGRFNIIIVEFHNLDALLNPYGFPMISACFSKLLKNFRIVHMHPNNHSKTVKYKNYEIPPLMEFTFLRKDRITSFTHTKSFPNPLDKPNLKENADIVVPECWYA